MTLELSEKSDSLEYTAPNVRIEAGELRGSTATFVRGRRRNSFEAELEGIQCPTTQKRYGQPV